VASFFAIALLFGLLNLSLDQLLALSNGRGGLMLGGERLLPSLATSLLATLLSVLGGPWAAIAYRGSLMAFEWLSPVLPAVPWLPASVAGTLAPGLAFTLVQSMTAPPPEAAPSAEARRKPGRPTWLLPFALALSAAVWFNTGLFGVQPAVVSGISMEPNLSLGDIVVTRGVDPASVAAGDVIKFRSGAVSVLHRVQEVQQGSNGRMFVTKGDNSNYLDPPVPEAALQGEVVLVIPKVGLLPVLVKNWLAR
jgi:signal peptidase